MVSAMFLPFGTAVAQTETECETAQTLYEECIELASIAQYSCNVGGSLAIGGALHYLIENDLLGDLIAVGSGVLLGEGCSNLYEGEVTQCTSVYQPAEGSCSAEATPPAGDGGDGGDGDDGDDGGDGDVGDLGDLFDELDDEVDFTDGEDREWSVEVGEIPEDDGTNEDLIEN